MPAVPPQAVLFFVSAVLSGVSHKLRGSNLPEGVNALISAATILLIVAVVMWTTSGFSPNLQADFVLGCSILMSLVPGSKELIDLLNYLGVTPSPLAPAQLPYPPTALRKSSMPFNLPPEE